MSLEHSGAPHGPAAAGHEERDVSFRPVVGGLIGLVLLLIVGVVLMRLLLTHLATREARLNPPPNPLAQSLGRQLPPEPRLQTQPLQDLLRLRTEEDATLTTYGWINQSAGIVRIPIERAMDVLAARGLPARPAPEGKR